MPLDESLYSLLEELGGRSACPVFKDAVVKLSSEITFAPQALHHGQHRRPRQAAGGTERFERFTDRHCAGVRDVPQQRQFLLSDGCISHVGSSDYTCRYAV